VLVAGRSLCGHVLGQRPAVLARPFGARPKQLGCRPLCRRPGGGLFLIFPLVGALIIARRPRNPIGWILLADGLLWMLSDVMDYYSIYGVAWPGLVPFPLGVAGINDWLWVPSVGLLGTYVFLLFPNGRLPSTRWCPLAWLAGVVIVLVSIQVGLAPGRWRTSGGTQPVRVSGTPLGDGCGVFSVAAVSALHAPLHPQPGIALRAFEGRGAPADQVDSRSPSPPRW
jgi:hypothetical protein